MCVRESEYIHLHVCVCSHSMLSFLFNSLLCQSLRCRRLREHSRSLVPRQRALTHTHRFWVCVLSSRWKCLLSVGVLADLSVSERAGEKEGNWGREKAEWKTLPIRSIIFVCVYASVCVIFPACSSCLPPLPNLIMSEQQISPPRSLLCLQMPQPAFCSLVVLTLHLQQARWTLPQSDLCAILSLCLSKSHRS